MRKVIRCIVACRNSNGEPDLFFVKVRVTDEELEDGVAYFKAEEYAEDQGYGGPMIVFDEVDAAGKAMLPLFEWDTADIIE